MESALYGIYAIVVFVSQILLVRCVHSFDFRYVNNWFPWIILYLPGLPFRKRRVKFLPWFFLRRRIALCSLKRIPVLAEYHVIDFRQFHWLRGKISLTCCREQQAGFCQSVALTLWFCCLYERSTIMFVEMFSDMCCLEDNASRNRQTNTVARSV